MLRESGAENLSPSRLTKNKNSRLRMRKRTRLIINLLPKSQHRHILKALELITSHIFVADCTHSAASGVSAVTRSGGGRPGPPLAT
ncbi:hypothetical protein EVAR_62729_1 [Eumeta japonica]|uniref:Uncharacterized protein n=1 Tax=Eumeta variegata TaxID=151549 RepID=A0A4C1ZIB8_EUMVA|nr:hypothetical protein EVAR_62729_1 [Eumeta japonica]